MHNRLSKLRNLLIKSQIDAILISSVPNIIYLTGFSYFSSEERDGYLLITKKNQYVITSGLYIHAARSRIKQFKVLEGSREKSFMGHIGEIIQKEKIKILGIEENNLTVFENQKINKFIKSIKHFDLTKLRIIKDKQEISVIKKACKIGDKAFYRIIKKIRIGMTEKEIALELEWNIRKTGADISFAPIVAFSENAAIPHHQTGDRKLKNNELVLIDFGVKLDNYCSDMTRTFFYGKAPSEQRHVYETILIAQNKAINYIQQALSKKEKAKGENADKAARDHIISQGFPSFSHRLGHGIGLEVHEAPSLTPILKDVLENGMVFSIEPGIYLPDKFGVRIEDLFAIENNKLVPLTHSPKELIEI